MAPKGLSLDESDKPPIPAAAGSDRPKLDDKTKALASIRVTALGGSENTVLQTGFARALDVGALAAIDADSKAAEATARASGAEAARLATLAAQDQSASRRAVEAAQAQAQADSAHAQLAARRVGLEFGPGLARLGRGGTSALVSAIASGKAALVRIDIPNVMLRPGATVRLGEPPNATSVRVLGATASADAKLQSAGVLAIVRGGAAQGLLAGRIIPAAAETGARQTGVTVPRDAIVRYQGALWVFVEKPDKSFERVRLSEARPVDDGWFVSRGLAPGTRVAVSGAGSLLAIETGGASAEDDG